LIECLKQEIIHQVGAFEVSLHLDEGLDEFIKRGDVVGLKCNADRGLSVEVVEYREHLLLRLVVVLETTHLQDRLKSFEVVAAEVVKQAVVIVGQYRRQQSKDLVVGDREFATQQRVTDQALPDVVLK
jgi:hypothetical protein